MKNTYLPGNNGVLGAIVDARIIPHYGNQSFGVVLNRMEGEGSAPGVHSGAGIQDLAKKGAAFPTKHPSAPESIPDILEKDVPKDHGNTGAGIHSWGDDDTFAHGVMKSVENMDPTVGIAGATFLGAAVGYLALGSLGLVVGMITWGGAATYYFEEGDANNAGGAKNKGGRQSPGTSGSTGRYTPEKGHDPGNTRGYQHRGGYEQDIPASVGGVARGEISRGQRDGKSHQPEASSGWEIIPGSSPRDQADLLEHEKQKDQEYHDQQRENWNKDNPANPDTNKSSYDDSDDPEPPPDPEEPEGDDPPPDDPGGEGGGGGDAYGDDSGDFFGPGLKKKGKGTSKTEKGPSSTMHGVLLARLGEGSVGSDESGWDSTHPKANDGDPGGVQPGGLRPKKSGASASQEESDAAAKKKQNKGLVSYNDGQVEGWEGNHPKMFGIAVGNIRG